MQSNPQQQIPTFHLEDLQSAPQPQGQNMCMTGGADYNIATKHYSCWQVSRRNLRIFIIMLYYIVLGNHGNTAPNQLHPSSMVPVTAQIVRSQTAPVVLQQHAQPTHLKLAPTHTSSPSPAQAQLLSTQKAELRRYVKRQTDRHT